MNNAFLFLSSYRPFCFKKKSSSVTTRVDIPTKVTNVFKSRDVNVCKNNLVTKSPLTFSNKLERSQTSKISTFFTLNSKTMTDSSSQIDNCSPSGQSSSAAPIKAIAARAISDVPFANGKRASFTSLDASLGFPEDNWDDFDDFEIPVKGKNVPFNSEKCEMSTDPVSEEKSPRTGKDVSEGSVLAPEKEQSCSGMGVLGHSVQYVAAVSPGPDQDQEDCLFGDSPVRPSRRRNVRTKSPLSDSDEDKGDEPCNEVKGKLSMTLFMISYNLEIKMAHSCLACYIFLEVKSSWIDPKVIELDDNSEPEDDLDFIPPSPVSDEMSSALSTRFVHLIKCLLMLLFIILKHIVCKV